MTLSWWFHQKVSVYITLSYFWLVFLTDPSAIKTSGSSKIDRRLLKKSAELETGLENLQEDDLLEAVIRTAATPSENKVRERRRARNVDRKSCNDIHKIFPEYSLNKFRFVDFLNNFHSKKFVKLLCSFVIIAIYFFKRPYVHVKCKLRLDVCPMYEVPHIPKYCSLRLQPRQFHVIFHTLPKSSCPCPHISPLLPPDFYAPMPNHPQSPPSRSKCPNHLNLPHFTTSATPFNTWKIVHHL